MLWACIGQKGREIYKTFTFDSADDQMKFELTLNKFSEYCNPRKNVTILRHKFVMYRQFEGQSFHDFITKLKKLSTECNSKIFKTPSLKIWSFVVQMKMPFVRDFWKNLISPFREPLVLGMLLRKFAHEILQSQSATRLHKINKLCKPRHQAPNKKSKETIKKCKFCNDSYPRGKCPGYGKLFKLQPKNHFKVCCPQNRKKVHKIEQTKTDCKESSDLEFFVEKISIQDLLI